MFERHKIKKLLKPRKEFTEQTKTAFLAVYDRAHPAPVSMRVGVWAKYLIACGALVSIFAGMSVYADTANVAADSPLYPLKRLGEGVQLAVAPSQEKAQLQATFATRRANEITDLETRKPSSTEITKLSTDLNTALNSSLNDAQNADLGDGKLTSFCDKVFSAIATSSVELRGNRHASDSDIVGRFLNQCGGAIAANATTTTGATTTLPLKWPFLFPPMPTGTVAASTTTSPNASGTPVFPPRFHRIIGTSSTLPFGRHFPTSTRPYRAGFHVDL